MADSADLGGGREGDKSDWSISKLVNSLKSTFIPADFAQVEAILDAREQKMRQEVEQLKKDKAWFSNKYDEGRLDDMKLQAQLKKFQTEHKVMENKVSKLEAENAVLLKRAKSAEDRCENLVAEVKELGLKLKESALKENDMFALRLRNHELECERAKLEDELIMANKRFEDLDKRVSSLESDLPSLMNEDDPKSVNGPQNGDSAPMGVKTVKVEDVSFGPRCDFPAKTNGNCENTGNVGFPSEGVIEIGDSDDESAPVDIPTLLHPADNGCSNQVNAEKGFPILKRKQTSSVGGENQNGDNGGNTLGEKLKMRKLEEPVCKPPIIRCSTTAISSNSDEVKTGVTTPKEEKSQKLLNRYPLDGFSFSIDECTSSSSSDSDDDNDGMHIIFNH